MLRRSAKKLFFVCGFIVVSPLIAVSWMESRVGKGEWVFVGCAQLLALVPSQLGVFLRAAFYAGTLKDCSWETNMGFGTIFTHRNAQIARNLSTGVYCVLGHVNVGPGVMMGSRVSIPSGRRQHFGPGGSVVRETHYDTVRIGEDCWIGEGAIVLADVGKGCVVSAGAVVTRATDDFVLVAGNPAQAVREIPQAPASTAVL